jgi:hypothetical protein
LVFYRAVFTFWDLTPASIAKALAVPRVLGTFITLTLANAAKRTGIVGSTTPFAIILRADCARIYWSRGLFNP